METTVVYYLNIWLEVNIKLIFAGNMPANKQVSLTSKPYMVFESVNLTFYSIYSGILTCLQNYDNCNVNDVNDYSSYSTFVNMIGKML